LNVTIKLQKPYKLQKEIIEDTARFKVVCAGRRVGKSTLSIILASIKMLEGKRIAFITPEYSLAEKFYEDILENFPDEVISKKNKARVTFSIKTGGLIKFFSGEAINRVRGYEFDFIVVDEAAHIPDLQFEWQQSLRPLLMKTRGSALFISSPFGKNYFYSLFQKGVNGEDGFKSWQFSSHHNPYLPEDELNELISTMPEAIYKQEILAEPGENVSNPFGTDAIMRNTISQLSNNEPVILAADLARVNDWTVIIGLDSQGVMCYFDRFRMPWEMTIDKLKELRAKFPFVQLVLDATGVGSVILERAQHEIYNVYGFEFSSTSKPKVIHQLIKAVEMNEIKFNDITAREMNTYQYKYSSSGNLKYEAAPGYNDDCVAALAMANHFKKSYSMQDTLMIF